VGTDTASNDEGDEGDSSENKKEVDGGDNQNVEENEEENGKDNGTTDQQQEDTSSNQHLHRLAGLKCDKYGGPSEESAQEMVYWEDIPSDDKYLSPFHNRGSQPTQYMTFEPDQGGWNNIRMAMETNLVRIQRRYQVPYICHHHPGSIVSYCSTLYKPISFLLTLSLPLTNLSTVFL
jgi:hypothetical protein